MFSIIKSIVWIAGVLFIAYWIMDYFGYEVNKDYFTYSKEQCEEKLKECSQEFIKKGTEGAECNFDCVDPKLIIKKK